MYGYGTSIKGCRLLAGWQLRFSPCSVAVTTKTLTMVVSLYYPLVLGSVVYHMPYAFCLGCCEVLLCCVSLSCSSGYSAYCSSVCPCVFSLKELCLSKVFGFCSFFHLVHSHDALWDSLFRHMLSGIACLASQFPDWAFAF